MFTLFPEIFEVGQSFHWAAASTQQRKAQNEPTKQPTKKLRYSDLEKLIDPKLAEISRDYWMLMNFSGEFVSHVLSFPEHPRYCKA